MADPSDPSKAKVWVAESQTQVFKNSPICIFRLPCLPVVDHGLKIGTRHLRIQQCLSFKAQVILISLMTCHEILLSLTMAIS